MRLPLRISRAMTAAWCVSLALTMSVVPDARRQGVRVHVVDRDSGVPVAHARLAWLTSVPRAPLLTDGEGNVTVEVSTVRRVLRVSKAGYAVQSVPVDANAELVDVTLARGAAVGGRVIDALGAPVARRGVRVSLVDGTEPWMQQTLTNDLGEYRVGALRAGTYRIAPAPVGPATPDDPAHVVVVREGSDVGGLDFADSRMTCAPPALVVAVTRSFSIGTSAIEGRAVTGGGMPLPCVEVKAYRGAGVAATAITDIAGHYRVQGLSAGSYSLEFARAGFVTVQWGGQQPGQPGRPVIVGAREQRRDIDVRIAHGSVISGTLLDEFLEPAENVMVRAFELRGDDRTVAVATATAVTDDRGSYRLFGLAPGRYLVGSAAAAEPSDTRTGTGYAPAYFPGEVDIAAARVVELPDEQERSFIDFARTPVRVATITGTAVNSRNEPVSDRVILVASQRSGAVIAETQGAPAKQPDGTFTIPNVPPGDYVVQATSERGAGEPREFGMQYVTVYQDDPMPVRIKTAPGLNVRGRLIEEGSPLIDPGAFTLTAIPVDWDQTSVLAGVQRVIPAEDGTLSLNGVTGPRRFALTTAPSPWYLKAIRLRGRDVTDEIAGFPLSGFEFVRDLEIVVSNKGAAIEGEVMDGSAPAHDCSVILFSSNSEHWFRSSRFLKTVRATAAGKFRIDGVADGDYFVAAVDPLDGSAVNAWQSQEFLNSLTVSARRVRVREGDERHLTLAVTHR